MTTRGIVPILRVSDVRAAERFYCLVLGFHKAWERTTLEAGSVYVALTRDTSTLHLSSSARDGAPGTAITIEVKDVDRLYAEFQRAGLEAAELEPTDRAWGLRELHVRDPDGNSLRFAAPIEKVADEPKYELSLVRVFVSDLQRSLDFYTRVLGMRASGDEGNRFARLSTGTADLGLELLDPQSPECKSRLGRFLGVSLSVPNIHASYWTLVSNGVEFVEPPELRPSGETFAHFKDPDSNVLTLVESKKSA